PASVAALLSGRLPPVGYAVVRLSCGGHSCDSWPKEQGQQLRQFLSEHRHDVGPSKLAEDVRYVGRLQPPGEGFGTTKEDILRPAAHPNESVVPRNSLRVGQGLAKAGIEGIWNQRAAQ